MLRKASLATLCSVAAVLAGCSDTTGPQNRASLSFGTRPSAAPAAVVAALSSAQSTSDAIIMGSLVITRVQLVLRKIELERTGAGDCASGLNAGDCNEMELGPLLVDLPLGTAISTPLSVAIPAGSYKEMEFSIHKVNSGDASDQAFLQSNPTFQNVSVRVEGTYLGVAFVFTSAVDAKVEREFQPPLVIGSAPGNITVNVDVSTWFLTGLGAVIDPTTANPGGPNESLVANNIKASFKAFEDDNRDGVHD